MKLPNHQKAVIGKGKIVGYLLSLFHPRGCHKAAFFRNFGFSADSWEMLAKALARHAAQHEVAMVEDSPFGTRYILEGKNFNARREGPVYPHRVVFLAR